MKKCECVKAMEFAVGVCPEASEKFNGEWWCHVHGRIQFGKQLQDSTLSEKTTECRHGYSAQRGFSGNPAIWCSNCGAIGKMENEERVWTLPKNSGVSVDDIDQDFRSWPVIDETLQAQVMEFHRAFCPDQGLGEGPPSIPPVKTIRLRLRLITEEYFEALSSVLPFDLDKIPEYQFQGQTWERLALARAAIEDAIKHYGGHAVDIVKLSDALADLDYVVEGTRIAFGVDGRPIADEVHRSNMSKVGGHRREDGKWIKPKSYSQADIAGELKKQGWKP